MYAIYTAVHLSHCFAHPSVLHIHFPGGGLQNPVPAAITAGKLASCSYVSHMGCQAGPLVCACMAAALHLMGCLWEHVAEVTTEALPTIQSRPADLRLMLAGMTKAVNMTVQSSLLWVATHK